MTQLHSDTIYKDLKQKGLQLSACAKIIVPQPQPPKAGLVKRLSSIVTRKKQQPIQTPMQVIQIVNNAFLVIKKRGIFIYKYHFDEQKKQIEIKPTNNSYVQYDVLQVFTCNTKYAQDRDFPIIFKTRDALFYHNFDTKQFTLTQRNSIKLPNAIGIGWITDRQCIFMDDKKVYHYVIVQQVLKEKSSINANLVVANTQCIKKTWIMANIDQQADSLVTIFYATILKEPDPNAKLPHMNLKVKQFIRTPDADIIQSSKPDYVLETRSLGYKDEFNIFDVGEYYCLQLTSEVLVMKKKFQKYMILDNMVQIMNGFEIKLNKKGLIVSIGEKLLELNCIHFSDPKCSSRICDVIEFPEQLTGYNAYFKQIWPIINQKQYTLIFVFVKEEESQITLSGLIKMEPMTKMMGLAKKNPKQKLQIIQDMALNLGIARKDFYLKLWKQSTKQNAHIYQYLIPCKDVNSIKKQLKNVLRTRTIQVSQILKILEKIQGINLQNLKKQLNQRNLKQYVKNHFLKKKILLNKMDILLDHRIFETIYNSSLQTIFFDIVSQQLDPVQPKFDPLHSSSSPQPYKQLKSLENVLQTFKVVLLQDYKIFLRQFLAKFPNKILDVLNRFSFLLPNHPFEIQVQKPSKTNEPILKDPKTNDTVQQLWFQTVTVVEWQAVVTKQSILKQLFYDYPTSKITETVDQFYNSIYGKQNKGWKHGLIILSLEQYTKKIKTLNGIQLYLDVCEFANQLSIQSNGDPKISEKILQVLKEKNKLTEPHINYCRLYANMHYFMLKNKIIPKNKLQISMLTSLKPQSLVAIFFLENKQRKQHIFRDFKDLYEDKNQFKQVLQKFIESQNCSRIQLQILINEIIDKGPKFQQQNQDLIELLIEGICMKVQIRQSLLILDFDDQQDQQNQGCLINDVQLSKHLALKVNRIKQLKRCKSIFKCFKLQKMTYKELLDLEKDNEVFKLILSRYFEQRDDENRVGQFEVTIEEQVINLQNPRNLLTVLVYLQQTVYYSARPFEVLLIFGLELLLWKQFDIMRELVNDDNALETLGVDKAEYLQTLIVRGLEVIYLDPQIVYDDQTKQQIINIISIDEEMSPLKIKQIAKLDLVDIFTAWGLEVHPSDIHTVCQKWKVQNRDQFMVDLIDNYVDKLDFGTFHEIYRLLQITDKETTEISHKNIEYVKFCDVYARKLLENKRYKEVIQIIVFLMNIPVEKIDYAMLAQSYLQSVVELYSEDEEKSRRFIQFFVQKYGTPEQYSIRQLLQSYFDDTVLGLWERAPTIIVNYQYNFEQSRKMICEVSLDDLWQMSKNSSENPSELYYNYFFLMMGLTNPKKGFGQTVGISYNLEKIAGLLVGDLDRLFETNQNLWFVDYFFIQVIFLYDGMLGEAAASLGIKLDKQRKSKFDMIVKQLRMRRTENQKNDKLLAILTKLKSQIFSKTKVNAKKERYSLKLKQIKEKQLQKNKQEQSIIKEPVQQQAPRPQVYLNWRKVQEEKKAISNISQYIMSEKDLIDQVYQVNMDAKSPTLAEKPKPRKGNTFENLFLPIKGMQKIQHLIELIKDRRYQEVGTYPHNSVIQAVQKIFNQDKDKQYTEILDVLDSLNIGDAEKKEVFRVAKFFLTNLPNQTKKILFPMQFLTTPIAYTQTDNDKYALIYNELRPRIQKITRNINLTQLRQLANLISVILQSPQYSARVYYETLIYLGQNAQFDSNSVLTAQQCIDGMGDYPELVSKNYPEILNAMSFDKQMRPYVRQNLAKLMSEKHYDEVSEQIKRYIC